MERSKKIMDREKLMALVEYDPETGLMTRRSNKEVIGRSGVHGYRVTSFRKKKYYVHRLAWIYMNGDIPAGMHIDHIDCDKSNNRIANLRLCTMALNQQNQIRAKRHNRTGLLGVSQKGGRYRASITLNRERRVIGWYGTPEEASAAYVQAKRRLHEFCTI